jgi:hypothetical protein
MEHLILLRGDKGWIRQELLNRRFNFKETLSQNFRPLSIDNPYTGIDMLKPFLQNPFGRFFHEATKITEEMTTLPGRGLNKKQYYM